MSEANEVDGVVMAAAMLYQKKDLTNLESFVFAVMLVKTDGDDSLSLKHKAERYCEENFSDQINGAKLVAWHFSVSDIPAP